MLRDTRIWKEFHLGKSPFNEISNDSFFNVLLILTVLTLIVNLISTVVVSGLFVSILDAFYVILFARYIYLYREYLDYNHLDSKNDGNFDEIKKEIHEDIQKVMDSTTIDEKIVDAGSKIKEKVEPLVENITEGKKEKSVIVRKNQPKKKILF